APQLDVVPGDGNGGKTMEGVDLPLHGLDVGDGREIQILAPDVRRKAVEEHLSPIEIARNGTRFDQRGALPVLAEALIVIEGGFRRDGKRCGARIGPQTQVGAEHIAITRALAEQSHEFARLAHKEGLRLKTRAQPDAGEVIEYDEVDV